jgi:hypothetical protein
VSIIPRVKASHQIPEVTPAVPAARPVLRWALPLVLCAAIAGALLVRTGLTVSTDEVTYLGVAHRLADGRGFTQPFGDEGARLERLGPMLPVVLGAAAKIGIDPLTAATGLNVILFAASVLLAAGLAYRITNGNAPAAIVTGLLMMTSRAMLQMHGRVLSEPLYVVLELACLHLLLSALDSNRRRVVLAAGLAAAAALATRYVGTALLATGVIAIIWLGTGRRGRRFADAAAFAGVSVVAVFGWLALSMIRGTSVSVRSFGRGALSGRQFRDAASTVSEWILTFRIPGPARLAVLAAGSIALALWLVGRRGRERGGEARRVERRGIRVLAIAGAAHVAVILLAMLFIDPNIRFESRLLLPAEVAAVPLLGIGAVWLARRAQTHARPGIPRPAAAVVLLLAVLALHVGSAAALVADGMGGGYQSEVWSGSPAMAAVRSLPAEVTVYSNAPEAIWFLTGRSARWLPPERDQYSGAVNGAHTDQVAALGNDIRGGTAVAVFLHRKSYWHMPTEAELRSLLGSVPTSAHPDGVLFGSAG